MSITGLDGLDRSIRETNAWLKEIAEVMGDARNIAAYHALRGVLFALRDRLPVEEVFDLSAQLPLLVRGVFLEAYRPGGKPEKFGPDGLQQRVRTELDTIRGQYGSSHPRGYHRPERARQFWRNETGPRCAPARLPRVLAGG